MAFWCIFLHEDSEMCRYGKLCERTNCMYKHEENVDYTVDISDTEDVDKDKHDENESDQTFINPFISGRSLVENLQCNKCDFITSNMSELQTHKEENYRFKWTTCDRTYESIKMHKILFEGKSKQT